MTDNQAQVDRIESKLDQLLDHHTKNEVEHQRFRQAADEVDAIRKKFWPLVGALTVVSPIVGAIMIHFLKGVI